MRTLIAGMAAVAALTAGAAEAQIAGRGAGYPMPGRGGMVRHGGMHVVPGRPGMVPGGHWNRGGGGRWQKRGGRWIGGWNAPGGWGGYRQPFVGWGLPTYWVQPGFVINNWSAYGLATPPAGYSWSRYYDDAVLIDGRGSVYDTVGGLDWDRYDDGYAYDEREVYDERVPVAPEYGRRDDGLGGAAIGAVAGGVAGNLIAGRGNRLGGTLIGAGVGGIAGYAIDKAEDRGRGAPPPPPPGYGAGYPPPPPGHGAGYPPPPPGYAHHGGGNWTSADGRTVVTTTGGGYYGGSTTTVVVQSAPVVTTTTTTEYYDDVVTYARPKVVKRKVWRRPTKTICRC